MASASHEEKKAAQQQAFAPIMAKLKPITHADINAFNPPSADSSRGRGRRPNCDTQQQPERMYPRWALLGAGLESVGKSTIGNYASGKTLLGGDDGKGNKGVRGVSRLLLCVYIDRKLREWVDAEEREKRSDDLRVEIDHIVCPADGRPEPWLTEWTRYVAEGRALALYDSKNPQARFALVQKLDREGAAWRSLIDGLRSALELDPFGDYVPLQTGREDGDGAGGRLEAVLEQMPAELRVRIGEFFDCSANDVAPMARELSGRRCDVELLQNLSAFLDAMLSNREFDKHQIGRHCYDLLTALAPQLDGVRTGSVVTAAGYLTGEARVARIDERHFELKLTIGGFRGAMAIEIPATVGINPRNAAAQIRHELESLKKNVGDIPLEDWLERERLKFWVRQRKYLQYRQRSEYRPSPLSYFVMRAEKASPRELTELADCVSFTQVVVILADAEDGPLEQELDLLMGELKEKPGFVPGKQAS